MYSIQAKLESKEKMNMAKEKLIIDPKHPKGEDGYRTFSVRIKEETVQRLEKVSRQTGRSRNELIAMFLEYALDNCEIRKK